MISGWVATLLLTACAVPQLVKILRTRQARDVSAWTWSLYLVGHLFAIVYAFQIDQAPLQIKYAVNIALAIAILYFKHKLK